MVLLSYGINLEGEFSWFSLGFAPQWSLVLVPIGTLEDLPGC